MQAKHCEQVTDIWVSSDSEKILELSNKLDANVIERPKSLAEDQSSSESGWEHALSIIEEKTETVDYVLAPQVTSPLREPSDFGNAIDQLIESGNDSLLSVSEIEDYFCWMIGRNGWPKSINYDFNQRSRRQLIEKKYLENGSFYIFRPEFLRKHQNRLSGKIEFFIMEKHKSFQIDTYEDIKLCETLMRGYKLSENIYDR